MKKNVALTILTFIFCVNSLFYVFKHKESDVMARDKELVFSSKISSLNEKIKPATVIGHNKEMYFNTGEKVNFLVRTTMFPVEIKSRLSVITNSPYSGSGNNKKVSGNFHPQHSEIRDASGIGSGLISSLMMMGNKPLITVGGAPPNLYTHASGTVMQRASENVTDDPVVTPEDITTLLLGANGFVFYCFL